MSSQKGQMIPKHPYLALSLHFAPLGHRLLLYQKHTLIMNLPHSLVLWVSLMRKSYSNVGRKSRLISFSSSNTHRFSRAADNSHTIPVEAIYPYPPGYSYQATHVALSPPENTVHNVSTNGPGLYHCPTTVESLPVPSKPIMFSQDVEDSPPAPTVLVTPQFTEKCDKRNSRHSNSKVDLAPLHVVLRHHPYRRDPLDDKALRMLGSRA